MQRCSPSSRLTNTYRTPTLICLGRKDRRVPASQGQAFYHMLRQQGVVTKLLDFPEDVHAIDMPASEADHWLAIIHWLATHMDIAI